MTSSAASVLQAPDVTRMIVQQQAPFNAEPQPDALIASFVTSQAIFYVRSHGDVPALGAEHAIVVGDHRWNQAMLERTFPVRTVAATLQCAGNRRADLQSVASTKGDPWGVGAIGNARWTGVSLIDVLHAAGIDGDGGYVWFTGADVNAIEDKQAPYGVSIAMQKACDPDVLIAWAMNGQPLAPDHGAPLRLIVPGYAGVRSIKWLTRIEVADTPSPAPIQARDYKLFPATVGSADEADWDAGLTIDTLPVNAAICVPAHAAHLATGPLTIRGYAMAYDRGIARVEVSIDGGESWVQAHLHRDDSVRWTWTLWTIDVDLAAGRHELAVRAIDTAGQGQPEHPEQVWNFAGYLATSWHRISVTAG